MGQTCFVECGEILQREFAKSFSLERFVPVFAVNGKRLIVMALEEQGVGEIGLNEDQVVAFLFLDPVADLISQTALRAGELRIRFKSAMSLNEILEHLPKLTEDEKRQLWNILDQQLADEGEESPEFLAELDARIRASDQGARTYSLDEARQMVRDTVTRARR